MTAKLQYASKDRFKYKPKYFALQERGIGAILQ